LVFCPIAFQRLEIGRFPCDLRSVISGAANQYVEFRDNGYWIAKTRVSVDSVVLAFRDGLTPETIAADCFPLLTLEQVYGAITWYLANRAEFDAYLKNAQAEFDKQRLVANRENKDISEKLMQARRRLLTSK